MDKQLLERVKAVIETKCSGQVLDGRLIESVTAAIEVECVEHLASLGFSPDEIASIIK